MQGTIKDKGGRHAFPFFLCQLMQSKFRKIQNKKDRTKPHQEQAKHSQKETIKRKKPAKVPEKTTQITNANLEQHNTKA